MNAVLHTKTLIWFGNCWPQKESNKGKSACNNHCSGNAADSGRRVLSTASGESHVRNATLQLSSFLMEGKRLRKMDFTSLAQNLGTAAGGGACEQLRFVPPSTVGSAHGAEQGHSSTARPSAYNRSCHV